MRTHLKRKQGSDTEPSGIGYINLLLYLVIIAGFFAGYRDDRVSLGAIQPLLTLAPEAVSGLLFLVLALRLGKTKELFLAPKYLVIGGLLVLHMFFGLLLSDGTSGTAVAGVRDYFKFVPLFLLPAVVELPTRTIRNCLLLSVGLCLVQVPLSIYQRMYIFPVIPTGDVVRGTFDSGALMSIFLVCAIAVMAAFWVRGKISLKTVLIISGALAIPMLINETKATVFLFVLAMVSLAFFSSAGKNRLVALGATACVSALFILSFATAYDYFYPDQHGGVGLLTFLAERGLDNEFKGIDDPSEVRAVARMDSIVLGFREISREPALLAFGHGIGNVSHPSRPSVVAGPHKDLFLPYSVSRTTYTLLIWEVGVVGLLLFGAGMIGLFADSRTLSRLPGFHGALGLAWTVVITVLPLAFLYRSVVHATGIMVVLMLISGVVAAGAYRAKNRRTQGRVVWAPGPATHSSAIRVSHAKQKAY
jgi:hypothetical protein